MLAASAGTEFRNLGGCLEAQQQYLQITNIPLAIVLQNSFVLVFRGAAQLLRHVLQNLSHRCEVPRGVSHHFGGALAARPHHTFTEDHLG